MSFESATQRLSELQSMTGAAQAAPAGARANGADAGQFATLLQQATTQPQLGMPGAPASSMASMLPVIPAATNYAIPVAGQLPGALPGYAPVATPGMYGPAGIAGMGGAGTVGDRMVALARGELGQQEAPLGSNESPRIREYRSATAGAQATPGPWCAYFVSWLASNAGAPVGNAGAGTGYVPTLESWGRATGRFSAGTQSARAGDIVIFDRNGDGTADHTGIVESVDAGGIHTIEGNTSDGVARRTYAAGTGQIAGLVHPG
jgi:hypothetical protein